LSTEEIIEYIREYQLSYDARKARLEKDRRVRRFINLLINYPRAFRILYKWKNNPKPLIIIEPEDFSYKDIKLRLLGKIRKNYHFIRDFVYLLLNQYEGMDDTETSNINRFLKEALGAGLLEPKEEALFYCLQCNRLLLTESSEETCVCKNRFDFKFLMTFFPDYIKEEMSLNHLLENFALHLLKKIKGLRLIGKKLEPQEEEVYTSIQYAGIGTGEKENAELDLLAIKRNFLIFIECKFNETTLSDINEFLETSNKLYWRVKEKYPSIEKKKIIFSYDASKLTPISDFSVISLKDITDYEDLIRKVRSELP